jgi:hypothetical protein
MGLKPSIFLTFLLTWSSRGVGHEVAVVFWRQDDVGPAPDGTLGVELEAAHQASAHVLLRLE